MNQKVLKQKLNLAHLTRVLSLNEDDELDENFLEDLILDDKNLKNLVIKNSKKGI